MPDRRSGVSKYSARGALISGQTTDAPGATARPSACQVSSGARQHPSAAPDWFKRCPRGKPKRAHSCPPYNWSGVLNFNGRGGRARIVCELVVSGFVVSCVLCCVFCCQLCCALCCAFCCVSCRVLCCVLYCVFCRVVVLCDCLWLLVVMFVDLLCFIALHCLRLFCLASFVLFPFVSVVVCCCELFCCVVLCLLSRVLTIC